MTQVEIKSKTVAELKALVDDASKTLFELNIKKMTGAPLSSHLFQVMRQQRARALTQIKVLEGKQNG